jgi:hypothetical protein
VSLLIDAALVGAGIGIITWLVCWWVLRYRTVLSHPAGSMDPYEPTTVREVEAWRELRRENLL